MISLLASYLLLDPEKYDLVEVSSADPIRCCPDLSRFQHRLSENGRSRVSADPFVFEPCPDLLIPRIDQYPVTAFVE